MQVKQILMYDSREDFYNWIVKSDLAINGEELTTNEKKKSIIVPGLKDILTYVDYVNFFQCDSIQTMAWVTPVEGEEKPRLNVVAIHIASMQYEPEETPVV